MTPEEIRIRYIVEKYTNPLNLKVKELQEEVASLKRLMAIAVDPLGRQIR